MEPQEHGVGACPPPPKMRRTTKKDFKPIVTHGSPAKIDIDPIVIETTSDTVEWDCSDIANHPPIPKPESVSFSLLFTAGPGMLDSGNGPFTLVTATGARLLGTGNRGDVGCYTYEVHATFVYAAHPNGVKTKVEFRHDPQIDNLPPPDKGNRKAPHRPRKSDGRRS